MRDALTTHDISVHHVIGRAERGATRISAPIAESLLSFLAARSYQPLWLSA